MNERMNWKIKDLATNSGVCRTKIFAEIKAGRLQAVKCGKSTLIPVAAAQEWLRSLPVRKAS